MATLLAYYVSRRQRRLLRQIDAERATIDVLQSALVNQLKRIPGTTMGTAYISATDGIAVGGDFYDAQPLTDSVGYFLVGDVSGKGVTAAVDTALVRHGLRALVSVSQDPGDLLTRLNEVFLSGRSGEEVFVVMFLGIIDTKAKQLRYASAGHSQAFLKRNGSVTQLEVTGPLLGILPGARIATEPMPLLSGDVVFLSTDGLTEARNADGTMLNDEGAAEWIRDTASADPQALADGIISRLGSYAETIHDDLAILALKLEV